jgi:hypothetical protein
MTYEFSTDFNDALPQSTEASLIPSGTIAKVVLSISAGGFGQDGWLTKSEKTGAVYINTELTITEGTFVKRKIFYLIGVKSGKCNAQSEDIWANKGRTMLRSILEAARNIHPHDKSDDAKARRKVMSLSELNGIEFAIKIGIEHDKTGAYPPKNTILSVITPTHKQYQSVMGIIAAKNPIFSNNTPPAPTNDDADWLSM